jgi:3-oxoacyl-[acyl-carrier-protein] synthase II
MALTDAGHPRDAGAMERMGVVLGASGSDLQAQNLGAALGPEPRCIEDIPLFADRILGGLNPLWLLINLPNMASAHVAIQMEARGPNNTIMTDWAAGLQAIGEACDWIRAGETDAVLAGGADSGVYPFVYGSYGQVGLLGNGRNVGPVGFVPGEGAGLFLLEDLERAMERGAHVYAEVAGYATTSGAPDAASTENPLQRAMEVALDQAGWKAADVDCVGLAGILAQPFHALEAEALDRTFSSGRTPAALEFASRLGHALAAASPMDLALLLGGAAPAGATRLLCNAIGYSGQSASIAVRRWPGRPHA